MRPALIKKTKPSTVNKDIAVDLITLVTEDIINKVLKSEDMADEDKEIAESDDFKNAVFRFILAETLKFALNNNDGYYRQEFAQAVQASQDLEEVMAKLIIECSVNPGLSAEILQGLCVSYIAKCNELEIEADESFVNLLFSNLLNK